MIALFSMVVVWVGVFIFSEALIAPPPLLEVTSGSIMLVSVEESTHAYVASRNMRAYVSRSAGEQLSIQFMYRGVDPQSTESEWQQIGLKLRAADTCNTLYVMWRILPAEGIVVRAKRNPGLSTHSACGARGYTEIAPTYTVETPPVAVGETHRLSAVLSDTTLRVYADGALVFMGDVPRELLAPNGRSGIRSDGAEFLISL